MKKGDSFVFFWFVSSFFCFSKIYLLFFGFLWRRKSCHVDLKRKDPKTGYDPHNNSKTIYYSFILNCIYYDIYDTPYYLFSGKKKMQCMEL